MIQRIQTIFLLLAAGTFAALLSFPFATSAVEPQGIFSDGKYSILDNLLLEILTGAGLVIAIVSIFMFRKRLVQMKLGYVLIVVCVLILAATILYFMTQSESVSATEIKEGPGLLMPLAGIVLAAAANYFIRKDEQLVKSMDRLR